MLAACTLLQAQDFRAAITGQVTDPTKAAIPGATIRAIRADNDAPTVAKTNQDGYYSLPLLEPGKYTLEVSAMGFKTLRRENVVLLVAEKLDLPIVLELGAVSTQITVSAEVETIETTTASGGQNFDPTQTSEYPLNGRQAYMLMELSPGVLFTQEEFGANGFSGTRGWDVTDKYQINGGVVGSNQFLLNGAPISLKGSWQIAPNAEAIQEFKVMTNTYDAQFGRTGGGTVNTTLKSGSNQWHGSMFEYTRNSVLDANTTQNNRVGAPRGKHITHQYGGTIGGPLRKKRDFVFGSFEGFRERVPFPLVTDTPPLDLRDGQHFSQYKINVFDPLTNHTCVKGVDTTGGNCYGIYIRNPFPGNAIPASRMSPIGKKVLSLYPAPNAPGETQNFFATNNVGVYRYDQPMARWDHVAGDRDKIYAVFTFQHGREFRSQNGFPPPAEYGNIYSQRRTQHYIFDWTRVVSPTMILDYRMSFGRFTSYFPDGERSFSLTAADLGMKMPHAPTVDRTTAPRIQLDLYKDIIGNNYTWGTSNQWSVAPSLTQTHGKVTRKFGGEFVYAGVGKGDIGRANGQFTFNRTWTQQHSDRGRGRGDGSGVADMLLGRAASGYVDYNDTYYRTWPYFAVYVQNDWRVLPRLTLNLGLRWDVQVPFVERWDRVNTGFDFNAKNPASDEVLGRWRELKAQYDAKNPTYPYPDPPAALYGGKTFVKPGGARRTYDTDWTNLQPRIGLAWNLLPKTVLRTGFGVFHRTAGQDNYTDGYSQRTNYAASFDGNITPANPGFTGPYSLQDPFPEGIAAPSGSSLGLLTNIGRAVNLDGRQRPIPRTYQYSFGLQRWLPWNVKLDASYVGSQTVHDGMPLELDNVSLDLFNRGHATPSLLNRKVPNPFYGILPATSDWGKGPDLNAEYLLRPFPLFNGVTIQTMPWARYRYDSLQVRLEKRFFGDRRSGGLLTVVSYTFAKSFSADHRLNDWNVDEPPIHELTSTDKPQNIALSGVLDLPFGRRRRFFNGGGRVVQALISDWNYNWIFTYYSGYPTNKPNAAFACASYLAPNGQTSDHWFNNDASCYKTRASYTLRDTEDRFAWIRNMSRPTLNMTIARTFRFAERWSLQLRGESFNTTNSPQFLGPNTDFKDPRFGMLPIQQKNYPRLIQLAGKILF
jgi:hypothetical protein